MVNGKSGRWIRQAAMLAALVMLAACNEDDPGSPAIAASSTVPGAPTISGNAKTSVAAGSSYSFSPTAADANGDRLSFAIENRPAWATFSTVTGALTGTPTTAHIGTYANVVIRVSDGTTSTALTAFSISVTQAGSGSSTGTGSAALSWIPPTENTDGSQLVNLAGYKIHYGTDLNALDKVVTIDNASVDRYIIENLSSATWFFAVQAYTSNGVESEFSSVATKVIS